MKNNLEAKRSFESYKTPDERKKYASTLMQEVKGHIPIVLQREKDSNLEAFSTKKV